MARVRITKIPKALSGLEVKMRPGLYGTNGNRQFTLPNQVNSQRFSQQPVDVRDTLQPVAREGANLEAEKGETAMVNIDGIPAHFKIGGKRHSKGGTPLNLPDNSFIFSDTSKMKIKDPMVHAQFGMVPKKSGYTPAEIAKKYDINTFRKILADPNSEDVERKTAEMMITNYNMKLAKLALVQESMKGFPQGIPAVAMPYVIANEIDPAELVETQGQEEQPDADMGVARYGGIPKAQKGLTHKDSVQHQVNKILDYEQLRGGSGAAPLPYYSDPKYNTMLMDKILPEVNKIIPNASAMEKGEAMDLIINAGWDENSNKITKDPRAFALQEYYRKNDPSKLDADGKWAGRKGAPYSFDQEYEKTIGNLPENERRIMMNKGRDWYYKNTAPKGSSWDLKTQGPHPNYKDTWYGRIWNTNDFNEFDPNNPNFTPKRYGGNMVSQFNTKAYGGSPMAQTGKQVTPGFGAPLIRKTEGEFAKKYPGIYNAYMQALNSGKPEEMTKIAELIESQQTKQTPWYSLDIIPGTDADMFENLATVLKETSKKTKANYSPENIKNAYKDLPVKVLGIYGNLKKQYDAIPDTDYMGKIDVDNKMKLVESLLPANKARYLSKAQKEPWQMYSKEDLGMINTMFDETFKPAPKTSLLVEKNKEKTKETVPVVEEEIETAIAQTEPVKTATTTKAKTTSTSSTGKKDLRTMTDAELEALLNE